MRTWLAVALGATIRSWLSHAKSASAKLRNDSDDVMRALDHGETSIVTRNGVPIATLSPLRDRYFTNANLAIEAFRNAPQIDYERFRSDIDAIVDQDVTPRT